MLLDILHIFEKQKAFFQTGQTQALAFRLAQLQTLYRMIEDHEHTIVAALKEDLRKPELEAYSAEIGFILDEIRYVRKRLRGKYSFDTFTHEKGVLHKNFFWENTSIYPPYTIPLRVFRRVATFLLSQL